MSDRLGVGRVHGRDACLQAGCGGNGSNVKFKVELFVPTLRDDKFESASWIAFEQRALVLIYIMT